MSRLLNLHEAATRLAESGSDILAQPEPARALQQAILHAMIMCFAESAAVQSQPGGLRHQEIVGRFEELLTAHLDEPLYLAEVCASIGVSERTLRVSCHEHLGMGPVRYLMFRRMHMAHRALLLADPATATVTRIAMDHGFWEFGRFAVAHRVMFGESPSKSLRRAPPDDWRNHPRVMPRFEFA